MQFTDRPRRPAHRAGRLSTCPRLRGLASPREREGSVNRHQPPTPHGVGWPGPAATLRWPPL